MVLFVQGLLSGKTHQLLHRNLALPRVDRRTKPLGNPRRLFFAYGERL